MNNLEFVKWSNQNKVELIKSIALEVRNRIMPDDYSFNYCGIASKELVSTLIIEGIWAKTVHGKYICEDHGRTLSLKHI